MSKLTKMALALLYMVQLMVVFREQLEHLYESAVETVHKHMPFAEPKHEHDHSAETVLGGIYSPLEVIAMPSNREHVGAMVLATLPLATLKSDGGHHDFHLHPHEHHDRIKKLRRRCIREIFLCNLWSSIRALRAKAAPVRVTTHLMRTITYA